MKLLSILFLLVFSFSALGQKRPVKKPIKQPIIEGNTKPVRRALQCSDYMRTVYDKISGKTYSVGRSKVIASSDGNRTGFLMDLLLSANDVIFSIKAIGADSCLEEKSTINILFTDDSRITLMNRANFNCDNNATVYLGGVWNNEDDFEQLATKKIEAMRVSTYKSSVSSDFTDEQATELKNQLFCFRQELSKNVTENDKTTPTLHMETQEKLVEMPSQKTNDLTVQNDTNSIAPKLTPPPASRTISGGVLNGKAESIPQPEYPLEAKKARAGGTVAVQVKIDTNGVVVSAQAVSGDPLLKAAAEKAALRAKFKPTILSGQKVNVTGVITYNFIL